MCFMLMVQAHLTILAGIESGSKAFWCHKNENNSKSLELIVACSREYCFEAEAAKYCQSTAMRALMLLLAWSSNSIQHRAWYRCLMMYLSWECCFAAEAAKYCYEGVDCTLCMGFQKHAA